MDPSWNDARARHVLGRLFAAAIAAADPHAVLARHLPAPPRGRCIVVGAGKAAASMAAAVEAAWPDVRLEGLVVTRYGHAGVPPRANGARSGGRIEVVEAAHPVPDEAGVQASRRILEWVGSLGPDDLVLALISGGGSALLTLPDPALTLADKQHVTRALLASGAAIGEINTVRRALSAIKGGRLALAAQPARVVTLLISDVPGDDPAAIASGPTVPPTVRGLRGAAASILARYAIAPTEAVARLLAAPESALHDPAHDPWALLPPADIRMIASPAMALRDAAAAARAEGLTPLILGDAIEGESRELGTILAGIAHSVRRHGQPVAAPAVLLSGGETTVTMPERAGRPAKGGRNTECLLALAVGLRGLPGIWALAGDTDGIDGNQDAAGAIVTPDTLARAHGLGLDPAALLAAHQSYRMFDGLGDLVRTGATMTNVNDFRAVLIV